MTESNFGGESHQAAMEFDYEGNIAEAIEAERIQNELAVAELEAKIIRDEEADRMSEAIVPFFDAVSKVEDKEIVKRQVQEVAGHLLNTNNVHLIARNIDAFIGNGDQLKLATKLVNNGYFEIVKHNIDKFDDPSAIKALMPGIF